MQIDIVITFFLLGAFAKLIGSEIQLRQQQVNLMQVLSDFNIRLICHGASKHNLCFLQFI